MTEQEWIQFDHAHNWHPYSGTIKPRLCLPVKSAEGVKITLNDGRVLLDGISSWWCMAHGHKRTEIVDAMKKQLDNMPHIMFGGLTHQPAAELSAKLLKMAPQNLDKVFYSDSGSVACEVAMKMALQYFYAKNERSRTKFLTVEHTYHGDTFATMALGGSKGGGMHQFFSHVLTQHYIAPPPPLRDEAVSAVAALQPMRDILRQNQHEIAAVIIEPLLQGAGGMRIYSVEYLQELRKVCSEFGILLILDEIATGFGRLGQTMFACQLAGVEPDIMCVGKGLTGGHITLAATLCTNIVAETISAAAPYALMHGPTFMANPLACAAANASLDIFNGGQWQTQVQNIENQLIAELSEAKNFPAVKDVRIMGAVGAIELKNPVDGDKLTQFFAAKGCWLRPFGNIIYTMPPFVMTEAELHQICAALIEAAKHECC